MSQQPPQYQQPTPGQPYGVPPGYPQPPTRRKKWPWIVGGLVLLSVLGCIGVFSLFVGGAAEVANQMDKDQKGENAVVGVMGKPATDGKFQFTVTGLECGLDRVGGEFGEKAHGEFCVVSLSVKNVADTAEAIIDTSQQAIDGKGNTYSVNSTAGISAGGDSALLFENINPGNTARGKLVFDVPEGTELTAVILHESMYTRGVKVPLKAS
jgi:uncharacterized protein DUF4352